MDASSIRIEGDVTILDFVPRKTGVRLEIPVFGALAAHLRQIRQTGPLCPSLAALSVSCLSRTFVTLLEKAGVCTQELTLENGRVVHQVSFHSLRHSMVSDLARRGVPENLRMKMSAHRTTAAHRRYEHTSAVELSSQLGGYFA